MTTVVIKPKIITLDTFELELPSVEAYTIVSHRVTLREAKKGAYVLFSCKPEEIPESLNIMIGSCIADGIVDITMINHGHPRNDPWGSNPLPWPATKAKVITCRVAILGPGEAQ